MSSYEPKAVPLDSGEFAVAFSLDTAASRAAAERFFDEYGFVVFEAVLTDDEQARTIDEIWRKIEAFCGGKLGIHRDDPSTWSKHWPGGVSGLLSSQASAPATWRNRANPKLRNAFELVIGCTDLVASADNYGVLRPTRGVPMHGPLPPQTPCRVDVSEQGAPTTAAASAVAGAGHAGTSTSSGTTVDQPTWKTKSKWVHWDMSPVHWVGGTMPSFEWSPYARVSENNATGRSANGKAKVQGLLNLIDARAQDGGFLCVPGFHKHLKEWVESQHRLEDEQDQDNVAGQYDFMEVPANDPLIGHTQRVPMRRGSLLVWNSELPHCNYSNDSERFRMVQYVKCFPAPPASSAGLDQRREQHTKEVFAALGEDGVAALSDSQRAMLGLEGPGD